MNFLSTYVDNAVNIKNVANVINVKNDNNHCGSNMLYFIDTKREDDVKTRLKTD